MKSLLKGSLVYGLGQVMNKTISLILLPFFTSYLSTRDYGITSIIGIYTLVVTSICTFGSGSVIGLIYFQSEDRTHRAKTINSAVAFLALTSLASMVFTILALKPLNAVLFTGESYSQYILLATLASLLNVIVMPLTLWMQFEQKALPFVMMNSAIVLSGALLNIVGVMILKWGVYGFIMTNLVAAILNVIVFFTYYISQNTTFSIDRAHIRQLLKLGWPLTFSFFFLFVIQNNSKYFLQLFGGLDAVGIFTIGFNLGTIISIIVNSFNTAYYPFIMSFVNDPEKAPAPLSAVAEKYVLAFCILLSGVFFAAKPIVVLLVDPSFSRSYALIGPVAMGWVFSGLFILIQPGLYYISRVHYISTVQMAAAVLAVAFSVLLIPRFGIMAAAWSFAFGNFSMFFIMHLVNRRLKISRYYNGVSAKIWLNVAVSAGFVALYSWLNVEKNLILFSSLALMTYLATMVLLNLSELRSIISAVQEKFKPSHAS